MCCVVHVASRFYATSFFICTCFFTLFLPYFCSPFCFYNLYVFTFPFRFPKCNPNKIKMLCVHDDAHARTTELQSKLRERVTNSHKKHSEKERERNKAREKERQKRRLTTRFGYSSRLIHLQLLNKTIYYFNLN